MRYVVRVTSTEPQVVAAISDAAGRLVYHVAGSSESPTAPTLIMSDADRRYVATIRQSPTAILPWGYEIVRRGRQTAKLHKHLLSVLGERLSVDLEGEKDDLDVRGDLLAHDYAIHRASRRIASVSKRWIARTDTYGVEIADGQDDVLLLASVLALEAMKEHAR